MGKKKGGADDGVLFFFFFFTRALVDAAARAASGAYLSRSLASATGSNEGCSYDGKSQTPCGKDVAAQHVCLLRMEALGTGLLRAWIKLCEDVVERTEERQIHILKV